MRQLSRGICTLCQREISKTGMARHLEVCRQKALLAAGIEHSQQKTSTFHLVIEASRQPLYWLHLAITTEATLAVLDQFLRDIWLECCGHLSAFKIGDIHYCEDEELFGDGGWGPRKQPLQIALDRVLAPGRTCSYEYDFGSTTELTLKVLARYEDKAQRKAIRILARNIPPIIPCDQCDAPAIGECQYDSFDDEYAEPVYLCAACAKIHSCEGQLMPLRQVNSPRAGVCGYTGPTNPAYL